MPISELTVPDRGDRPDPLRPLEDDADAVALRKAHVAGEAIAHGASRVLLLTGALLMAIVGVDLGLMAIHGQDGPRVLSVGTYLAFDGNLARTPQGNVPRSWPAFAPSSSGPMLVGGLAMAMTAIASTFFALAFGLARLRTWAAWGCSLALLTICGIAGWMHSGLTARLDGGVLRMAFDPRQSGRSLTCFALVLVAFLPIALMTPTARAVFRSDYRDAVARSPRLRPWRSGRALPASIFVGLLAAALFLLVVFGPLAMLGQGLLRAVQKMAFGD